MKSKLIYNSSLIMSVCGLLSCSNPQEQSRPNIVFILADDLGYMDVGAFANHTLGTPVDSMFFETPNINRLASEGTCFSSAYVCPLSAPTRSEIMTGRYAATMGFTTALPSRDTWYMTGQKAPEGQYIHDAIHHADNIKIEQAWNNGKSNSAIPAGRNIDNGWKCTTLPEALDGYYSAFVGKWHLGGMGADGYQPGDRGFDEVLAYFDGGGSTHFNWRKPWSNKSKQRFPKMPQSEWKIGDPGEDSGEEFLTDDLTKKALDFLDKVAQKKDGKPFMLYFSHFAVHSPIQARKADVEYFDKKETKGWNNHKDPVYAGLVKGLDDSVGKILAKLDELHLADNTMVVFLSDNGGVAGKITPHDNITDIAPYLGGKATVFEGGIKTPMIIKWKGHAPVNKWCDVTVQACDIFPTLLEVGGIDPTHYYNDENIDGRSFLSLLSDIDNKSKIYPRDTFMFHYPFNVIYNNPIDGFNLTPHSAIRSGNMKLIFDWHGRLYLFDMKKDPYERNNIAGQRPEVTRELFDKLMVWLNKNVKKHYWPSINNNYDASKEVRKNYPFIDLVSVYNSGGDVVKAAVLPDMNTLVIP